MRSEVGGHLREGEDEESGHHPVAVEGHGQSVGGNS